VRLLFNLCEGNNFVESLIHFISLEMFFDGFNCLRFEGALFLYTVLDIFGHFVDLFESDQSVDDFGINERVSIEFVLFEK